MVLIELVYCRITGKTRSLPKIHHFVPLEPWSCRKIKGKRRVMKIDPTLNGGPPVMEKRYKKNKKDQIKLVLDMSNDGPMFKMVENLMKATGGDSKEYDALSKLLKSGIPGMEGLFEGKGFSKMSDEDKKRFLSALTSSDGKLHSKAAAVLIAAAASGGDPEIANKIVEKMMSSLGDDIDPAMMAALMATTAMVAQGASNEEVLKAMQQELANSGLSPDEILAKTMLLQKAMQGDNSPAFINKTLQNALNAANLTPKELAKALFMEKVLSATGATPEDLAKVMLLQAALANKGLSPELIARALNEIAKADGNLDELVSKLRRELSSSGISQEEIEKAVAMVKAMEGGKIRGLKGIQNLLEKAQLDNAADVIDLLRKAFESGDISPDVLARAMLAQKVMKAIGADPEVMAKTIALQKTLAESGMAKHEIANAMSLALSLGLDQEGIKDDVEKALQDLVDKGLSKEDIEAILALTKAVHDGAEIPPETIRLLKKAMKQRRGSVENVAETLMATLAASGESKENIAKAMVRALKATGASPEEIARTMGQALEKSGATNEEIARALAGALADSGATGEEIAKTMKEVFSKAIKDDPGSAADVMRTIAEALAEAGASTEDIAETMRQAMEAGMKDNGGNASPDDILDITETVARILAEAGASPEDIAGAMKAALDAAKDKPELADEITKTMARAMNAAGATGEDIARNTMAVLAESGMSKEDAAQLTMEAVAASGAKPDDIAKTMHKLIADSALSAEDVEKQIIDVMAQSGASSSEVAQALAQHKLLQAIGDTPESMAQSLLQAMRSGEEISKEMLQQILLKGGIKPEAVAKALMLQKALGGCGLDPEDMARTILLQKAMVASGAPPELVAKVLKDIVAKGKKMTREDIDNLVDKMMSDDLDYDDVMRALQFNQAMDSGEVSMGEVTEIMKNLRGNSSKEDIAKAADDLIKTLKLDPSTISKTTLLQKAMTELGVSPDDIAKFMALQKSMYDAGASPQDIAMVLQAAMDAGDKMTKEELAELLRSKLGSAITAADVAAIAELADSFKNKGIPPEVVQDIALLQKAIEAKLSTPEQLAKKHAAAMRQSGLTEDELAEELKALLSENNLTKQALEKGAAVQKVAASLGLKPEEMKIVMELEKCLAAAGKSKIEMSQLFQDLVAKGGTNLAEIGEIVKAGLDQTKMKEEDILVCSDLLEALSGGDVNNNKISSINNNRNNSSNKSNSISNKSNSSKNKNNSKNINDSNTNDVSKGNKKSNNKGKGNSNNKDNRENNNNNEFSALASELEKEVQKKGILEKLQKVMAIKGLKPDALAKALILQKVMASTSDACKPEDMAKLCRIQNTLLDSGVPASTIARAVSSLIDLKGGTTIDKLKSLLDEIVSSNKINLGADGVDFAMKFSKGLSPRDGQSPEAVRGAFEAGLEALGLTNEDMARAMLVQKTLSATGVSPEALSQLLLFQKTLAASGASAEEIAKVLSDAVGKGLSDKEIADIMEKAMSNPDMSPEDIANMVKLQESLKGGFLKKSGVSQEVVDSVMSLQKALEDSGLDSKEIIDIIAKTTSEDLSEEAVADLMSKVLAGSNVDKEVFDDIVAAKKCLENGDLKGLSLSPEAIKKVTNMKKALSAAGVPKEKIDEILTKVANGALSDKEADAILKELTSDKALKTMEKEILKDLKKSLKANDLKGSNMKAEDVDNILTLSKALEATGASKDEIADIVKKVASGEMSEKEMEELVKKLDDCKSIPSAIKDKMAGLKESLISGAMTNEDLNKDAIEQVLTLAKAMEGSGATEKEIQDLISKATTNGLGEKEVDDLMSKITERDELLMKEDEISHGLKKKLKSKKLKGKNVDENVIDNVVALSKALEATGASKDEINEILTKAASGTLSKEEAEDIISKIAACKDLPPDVAKKLNSISEALKTGGLQMEDMDSEAIADMVSMAKVLEKSGLNAKEAAKIIAKATGEEGLSDKDIEGVKNKMLEKDETLLDDNQIVHQLKKKLKSNKLKGTNIDAKTIDDVVTLSKALEASGMGADKISETLAKIAKGDLKEDEVKALIETLSGVDDLPAGVKDKLDNLIEDLKCGNLKFDGVDDKALEEVLALSKVLESSGVDAEDAVKLIAKAASKGLSDKDVQDVAKTLTEKDDLLMDEDEVAGHLKKIIKSEKLQGTNLSSEAVDNIVTLSKALEAAGKSEKEIADILAKVTKGEMTKEETEKLISDLISSEDMPSEVKEKLSKLTDDLRAGALTVDGISDEALDQVIVMAKVLEGSGVGAKDIVDLITKAAGSGLSDSEVDKIMDKVTGKETVNAIEKSIIGNMKKNLKKGKLKGAKMKAKTVDDILTLSKALEAAGADKDEIQRILSKATKDGLSEKEIQDLEKKLKAADLPPEVKEKLEDLMSSLKEGKLKVEGMDKDKLDEMLTMAKVLEASGKSASDIQKIISKASGEGLSDKEVDSLMKDIENCGHSLLDQQDVLDHIEDTLKADKLKDTDLTSDTLEKVLTLGKALKAAGHSEEEINDILAKVTKGDMSKAEVNALIDDIAKNAKDLPPELTEKLNEAMDALKSGNLKVKGMDEDAISQLTEMAKVMEGTGASEKDIIDTILKASKDGLTNKEIKGIMDKVTGKGAMKVVEKEVLGQLEKSLQDGALKGCDMSPDKVDNLLALSEALKAAGKSQEEISDILIKVTKGDMTKDELASIVKTLDECQDLPSDIIDKLPELTAALRSGGMKVDNMDKEALDQMLTMANALDKSGASKEEIKNLISKATTDGLSDKEIKDVMDKVTGNKEGMLKVEKELMSGLEKNLKSGMLKGSKVKPAEVENLLTLSKALEAAGKSEEEISEILSKVTKGEMSKDEMTDLINTLDGCEDIPPEIKDKMSKLKTSLKSGAMKNANLTDDALDQVMVLAKAMEKAGASPEEIKKIISKATTEGLTDSEIKNIMGDLTENKSSMLEVEKEILGQLEDTMKSGKLKDCNMQPDQLDSFLTLSKALEAAGKSQEEISDILAKVAQGDMDQKDMEELVSVLNNCKDMPQELKAKLPKLTKQLKASKLKVDGADGDTIDEVLTLAKALERSGTSEEDIKNIIMKATTEGLTENEVKDVMDQLTGKGSVILDKKDILGKLEKTLKSGELQATGMKPDVVDKVLALSKALEASGMSQEEISNVLAKVTQGDLSEEEAAKIMDKLAACDNLPQELKDQLPELAKSLRSGSLKVDGMDKETLEQVIELAKALEESGADAEEVQKLIAKATGAGLDEKEIEAVMKKVQNSSKVSSERKKKLKEVEKSLKAGKLRSAALKENALNNICELQSALEAAGVSQEEIADILSNVTSKDLTDEEIEKIMAKILQGDLSEEEKQKLEQIKEKLKSGALKTQGMTSEIMEQVLLLKTVLEATGAGQDKVKEMLAKAVNQGLSKKEINDVIKKAIDSRVLNSSDRAKLKDLKKSLEEDGLKIKAVSPDAINEAISLQKVLEESGASEEEIAAIISAAANGEKLSEESVQAIVDKVLEKKDIPKEVFDKLSKLQSDLSDGKLKTPGMTADVVDQVVLLQKALEKTGASPEEIASIIAKATGPGLTDQAISDLMTKVLNDENLSSEEREKLLNLQKNLKDGSLRIGNNVEDNMKALLESGQFDKESLAKALLAQKIMSQSGMSPEDLAKATMLQEALTAAGASPETIAEIMKKALEDSGMDMNEMMKSMEKELKATGGKLSAEDITGALQFEKLLGSKEAAEVALRKLNPEQRKLLETLAKGVSPDDTPALIKAMKDALGDSLDDVTAQALDVHAAMEKAGASKEEIQEMMAMMMNKGGGVSQEFLTNIKKAMESGSSPQKKLELLKDAMEEEMNSMANTLRNTFLNKIPTEDEITNTCRTLADKLAGGTQSRNDVKLALMDVLEEALQDIQDYEPDADMLFNYLMVSALAEAADRIERQGLKPSGAELEDYARQGILDMIQRLLLEAELPDELSKLDVFGRTLDGLKELLNHLLKDPRTSKQLRRQVAFLFDFDEIEHTTVLGLTLRDILKDAKHKLKPWELAKYRKVRGFRWARMPNLSYSQVYCFYKVLPEHLEGPAIGFDYDD